MTDFRGRASRTDFFFGLIVLTILGFLAWTILEMFVETGRFFDKDYVQLAASALASTCFVRRLHDQDRSGWWALIMVPLLAKAGYEQFLYDTGQIPVPELGWPYVVPQIALVLVFWGLALWPGTAGSNQYGLDPRLMRSDGS
jgi:uncharacterized membrane protein YhaH (DUF805 family)